MLAIPPLHGAYGILDELLAFGVVLAFFVGIYFVSALFRKKDKTPKDKGEPKWISFSCNRRRRDAAQVPMILTLPPLHGVIGYADELVALGIAVAVGLTLYFVFALIEAKEHTPKDKNE